MTVLLFFLKMVNDLYDGAFFAKQLTAFKALIIFTKNASSQKSLTFFNKKAPTQTFNKVINGSLNYRQLLLEFALIILLLFLQSVFQHIQYHKIIQVEQIHSSGVFSVYWKDFVIQQLAIWWYEQSKGFQHLSET